MGCSCHCENSQPCLPKLAQNLTGSGDAIVTGVMMKVERVSVLITIMMTMQADFCTWNFNFSRKTLQFGEILKATRALAS